MWKYPLVLGSTTEIVSLQNAGAEQTVFNLCRSTTARVHEQEAGWASKQADIHLTRGHIFGEHLGVLVRLSPLFHLFLEGRPVMPSVV